VSWQPIDTAPHNREFVAVELASDHRPLYHVATWCRGELVDTWTGGEIVADYWLELPPPPS
jgi:hypothetical protein